MGGKTVEARFDASPEQTFEAARVAVAQLGYSVVHTDAVALTIAFNTGRSMSSFAGQDLTATIFAEGQGSRVVVGGSLAKGGSFFGGGTQLVSWGEKGRLSQKFLDEIGAALPSIATPAQASPSGNLASGLAAELERLTELRAGGALDEKEFAAAKAQLLGTADD